MADLFDWMEGFFGFTIATVGTTDITLGLMLAFSLIATLVLGIFKKGKGRG
jgi:hypothetical protein